MAEIISQYRGATVLALGWNRLRGVEEPGPETGLGFFALRFTSRTLLLGRLTLSLSAWQFCTMLFAWDSCQKRLLQYWRQRYACNQQDCRCAFVWLSLRSEVRGSFFSCADVPVQRESLPAAVRHHGVRVPAADPPIPPSLHPHSY